METNEKYFLQKIVDLGATRAEVVNVEDIELDASFRKLCHSNECGMYGKCWMCPPDIGEIDELMKALRKFSLCFVYQTVGTLADSFDFEGMMKAKKQHFAITQKVQQLFRSEKSSEFLLLSTGGCGVCNVCAKESGSPCRYPQSAVSSLEAYGVNVSQLAKLAGIPYSNGKNTVTYFGIVLVKKYELKISF